MSKPQSGNGCAGPVLAWLNLGLVRALAQQELLHF
jgi:hypothetical protein